MAKKTVTHPHKGYKADIDDATMQRMEQSAGSLERGQQRRVALLVCARNSDTIVRLAKEEPQAFEEMADLVMEYHKHAQGLLDVASSAFARIAMAAEMSEATPA